MARGEGGEEWTAGATALQPTTQGALRGGACAGRVAHSPACVPAAPAGRSRLQQRHPTGCREGAGSGGQRSAEDPAAPPTPPPAPRGFLFPQPTRACSNPTGAEETQKKARPPGPEPRSSRKRSARSSIPGGRSRARGRREGAIHRGCAGMLPGRPAAAALLPAPLSGLSPRRGWMRAACASCSGSGVAWQRAAGGGSLWSRPGRRTDTRSREGGSESPAWGRSEAAAGGGGGGGGGVDSAAAAGLGLLSTSGPWSGDREVGAAGGWRRREGASGGPVAARRGGGEPRRTMHLGVKPWLRVSGSRPRPLCLPATVEDRATKAEPRGPASPRGPSPARLFRIRRRRRRVGEGWC